MPSDSPFKPSHTDRSSSWIWPVLIIAIASTIAASLLYVQKMSKQIHTITEQQEAQYESRKFLLSSPDVINVNWMRTLNPLAKNISGDIVWSSLNQQGIMRFANLPKLPADQQYHLWIYDLAKHPDDVISVVEFSPVTSLPTELLIPFTSSRQIEKPYKFMVMLDSTETDFTPQPLLLGQP